MTPPRHGHSSFRLRRRLVAALLLPVALALGACADDDGDAAVAGAESEFDAAGEVVDSPGAAGDGEAGSSPQQVPTGSPLQASRSLIQRADVSLRVDDVEAAAAAATAAAQRLGGFLSGQQLDRRAEGATGVVQLRVPSEEFVTILDEVSTLGEVLSRNVDTQDVTGQVVDLESRLTTAQASLARVRDLLGRAATVEEIVRLEAEVASRETLAEQLQGQLDVLRDQVSLSDVTVRLGAEVPPPPSDGPEPSDEIPGFSSGLDQGWVVLQNVVGVVLTVLGFLLPFLVPAAPVVAVLVWWVRRRRQPPAAPA